MPDLPRAGRIFSTDQEREGKKQEEPGVSQSLTLQRRCKGKALHGVAIEAKTPPRMDASQRSNEGIRGHRKGGGNPSPPRPSTVPGRAGPSAASWPSLIRVAWSHSQLRTLRLWNAAPGGSFSGWKFFFTIDTLPSSRQKPLREPPSPPPSPNLL